MGGSPTQAAMVKQEEDDLEEEFVFRIDPDKLEVEQCVSLVKQLNEQACKICEKEDICWDLFEEFISFETMAHAEEIQSREHKVVTVIGDTGIGKSALINIVLWATEPPQEQVLDTTPRSPLSPSAVLPPSFKLGALSSVSGHPPDSGTRHLYTFCACAAQLCVPLLTCLCSACLVALVQINMIASAL